MKKIDVVGFVSFILDGQIFFADEVLANANKFCDFAFEDHHIKKLDSRRKNAQFFTCIAHCTVPGCNVLANLSIKHESSREVEIKFTNDSCHDTSF